MKTNNKNHPQRKADKKRGLVEIDEPSSEGGGKAKKKKTNKESGVAAANNSSNSNNKAFQYYCLEKGHRKKMVASYDALQQHLHDGWNLDRVYTDLQEALEWYNNKNDDTDDAAAAAAVTADKKSKPAEVNTGDLDGADSGEDEEEESEPDSVTELVVAVGSRVRVWWPEDQAYYNATVLDYRGIVKKGKKQKKKPWYIEYDDGESEWIDLNQHKFQILPPPSSGGGAEKGEEEEKAVTPNNKKTTTTKKKPLKKVSAPREGERRSPRVAHVDSGKDSPSGKSTLLLTQAAAAAEDAGNGKRDDDSDDDHDDDDDDDLKLMASTMGTWGVRFLKLHEYKDAYGHCNVPHMYSKLGMWVPTQRRNYEAWKKTKKKQEEDDDNGSTSSSSSQAVMTQEKVDMLNRIGFDWDKKKNTNKSNKLNDRTSNNMGDKGLLSSSQGKDDNNEEEFFDCEEEGEEQEQKQPGNRDSIGGGGGDAQEKASHDDDEEDLDDDESTLVAAIVGGGWGVRYLQLKQYKKEHGHCRVPTKCAQNKSLGYWVGNQRTNYKAWKKDSSTASKKMTKERVDLLNRIGFCWNATNMA